MPQPVQAHDGRGALPRRFTTDSGRVPTLSSITNQRGPEMGNDYNVRRHLCAWHSQYSRICHCDAPVAIASVGAQGRLGLTSELTDFAQGSIGSWTSPPAPFPRRQAAAR